MSMDYRQSSAVSAELAADERVLWSDKPNPATAMMYAGPLIPFSVVFLAMAINGAAASYHRDDITGMAICMILAAFGGFILCLPLNEYFAARHIIYVITNRRLLILHETGKSATSLSLKTIAQVERVVKGRFITLKIPTATVDGGEDGRQVMYTILHGLSDGPRAYQLLTQPGC